MTNKVLTDAQLYTVFTDVERILNSRPLTNISDHVDDLEALTPNHVLLGLHRRWSYICDIDEKDLYSRKKYRQVLAISAEFWRRWRREYLPKLTTRGQWRQHLANLKVGQLVLLVDDEDSRKTWPHGYFQVRMGLSVWSKLNLKMDCIPGRSQRSAP